MSHTRKLTALFGAIALLGTASLSGQQEATGPTNPLSGELPDLSAGTRELGVFGNLNWADDTVYNLNVTYGWFTKDDWQVGGGVGFSGINSDLDLSLNLFTEYHWVSGDSKWTPFVGANIGWARLDRDSVFDGDSISVGLDVGVKYFIQSNVALSFSVGADYAFDDVFPGGDDFNKQLNIGTRFYF